MLNRTAAFSIRRGFSATTCLLGVHHWHDSTAFTPLSTTGRVVECAACGDVQEWTTQSSQLYSLAIRRGKVRHR